jgi:hypothetical protein
VIWLLITSSPSTIHGNKKQSQWDESKDDELTGGVFALFINKRELSIGDQASMSKPSLRTVDITSEMRIKQQSAKKKGHISSIIKLAWFVLNDSNIGTFGEFTRSIPKSNPIKKAGGKEEKLRSKFPLATRRLATHLGNDSIRIY